MGSARLGTLLGTPETAAGRMKRDAWEEYFGDVVQEMHLGLTLKQSTQFDTVVRKNPYDGAEMVYVPAGEFTMGSIDYEPEKPIHKVTLDGYYIYRTPVTVSQYLHFCYITGYRKPLPPTFNPNWMYRDHPIVNVSYINALAYCTRARVKLPTEAQWEKAARGTDSRIYPWGNEFDRYNLLCSTTKFGDAGGT